MIEVFLLVMVTDLGPALFTLKQESVVGVFHDKTTCELVRGTFQPRLSSAYITLVCREETVH